MVSWIRISKFCAITGDTDDGVRASMARHWPEGIVWAKAPNGCIYIHMQNFNLWVEGKLQKTEAKED